MGDGVFVVSDPTRIELQELIRDRKNVIGSEGTLPSIRKAGAVAGSGDYATPQASISYAVGGPNAVTLSPGNLAASATGRHLLIGTFGVLSTDQGSGVVIGQWSATVGTATVSTNGAAFIPKRASILDPFVTAPMVFACWVDVTSLPCELGLYLYNYKDAGSVAFDATVGRADLIPI
jgi:hypothetical protein